MLAHSPTRSPFVAAFVAVALANSSEPLADLGDDEDEETILLAIGFNVTPDQCKQLRWLIFYCVLLEVVEGKFAEARCKVAIARHEFPNHDFPPSTMQKAWDGKSGVGGLARAIARKMTAEAKALIVADFKKSLPDSKE